MLGVVEPNAEAAVKEMAIGVSSFVAKNPQTSIKEITFVVYNDQKLQNLLRTTLNDFIH